MLGALFVFLLCFVRLKVSAVEIDNAILGLPKVTCASNAIRVKFSTKQPFEGNIYAKGFYMILGCRVSGHDGAVSEIVFGFTEVDCGLKRVRSMNPMGLSVEVTVVISFHPSFITKTDRAYRVSCFYMEAEKTVSSELAVSMLTTQMAPMAIQMPTCKYEILSESIDGKAVTFGKVGDKVYHKWSCEASKPELFCLTVHSCFVDNAAGDPPVPVIDEFGCAIDKHLIDNLEYFDNLLVGQESHVFKFADKPSVVFNCQLRLSINEKKSCGTLIPRCYSKREVSPSSQPEEFVDFDFQPAALAVADPQVDPTMDHSTGQRSLTMLPTNHLCVTWLGISFITGVIIVALCTLLGTVFARFDRTGEKLRLAAFAIRALFSFTNRSK